MRNEREFKVIANALEAGGDIDVGLARRRVVRRMIMGEHDPRRTQFLGALKQSERVGRRAGHGSDRHDLRLDQAATRIDEQGKQAFLRSKGDFLAEKGDQRITIRHDRARKHFLDETTAEQGRVGAEQSGNGLPGDASDPPFGSGDQRAEAPELVEKRVSYALTIVRPSGALEKYGQRCPLRGRRMFGRKRDSSSTATIDHPQILRSMA